MWIGKILFFLTLLLCNFSYSKNYKVRVLLQEAEHTIPVLWKVVGNKFVLVDPENKTKTAINTQELLITKKKNNFCINGVVCKNNRFYICPAEGNLQFNGKEYHGSFLFVADPTHNYLINSLDLEEYVCSVLRTESWPGWPLEVNKAFAIASRSYVIGIILTNKANKLPYHVKNTNKHQTYSGVHADPILKDAVAQTKGIFLSHEGKPIIAMFDSCCGGVIPAHIHGVNFSHAPYLERHYACNFCKDCKMFNWKFNFSLAQFEQMLQKEFKQLKKIKQVKIIKTDKAGLVQQVSIKGHNHMFCVSGKKIYSLFSKKIKSFCFDVAFSANNVIFNGKGIGHHLGLCQWGAREMVRQGYDFKSVLNFYYPNTSLMRLQ